MYVFFFKQKTSYEMRISDWSSDVCSSDLFARFAAADQPQRDRGLATVRETIGEAGRKRHAAPYIRRKARQDHAGKGRNARARIGGHQQQQREDIRSEEHTSELQSLMRISYAVFCLKKKKNTENTQRHTTINDHSKNTHKIQK